MVTKNKNSYDWIDPKVIIKNDKNNTTSYILYNEISNFNINGDRFKIIHIDITNEKSPIFLKFKSDYRLDYVTYLNNLQPTLYSTNSGFSSIINAIKLTNENLILLYKNSSLVGALSYDINDKKKSIEISHIGVLEKMKGYGSILIYKVLSLAISLIYKVYATSNGYADDFYHSCGLLRTVDKPLGIYMFPATNDITKIQFLKEIIYKKGE